MVAEVLDLVLEFAGPSLRPLHGRQLGNRPIVVGFAGHQDSRRRVFRDRDPRYVGAVDIIGILGKILEERAELLWPEGCHEPLEFARFRGVEPGLDIHEPLEVPSVSGLRLLTEGEG